MNNNRYSVIFTGQIKAELSVETVISNLVLDIGLDQQKAVMLLRQGRVMLKRSDTMLEAQRLAEKFDRAGAICIIEDRLNPSDAQQSSSNESSLVRIINKFIPSSRHNGATAATRKG